MALVPAPHEAFAMGSRWSMPYRRQTPADAADTDSDHLRFDAADVTWSPTTLTVHDGTHFWNDCDDVPEVTGEGYSRGGDMARISANECTVSFGDLNLSQEDPEDLRKRAKELDKKAKAAKKAEAARKAEQSEREKDREIARSTYRRIAISGTDGVDRISAADRLLSLSRGDI